MPKLGCTSHRCKKLKKQQNRSNIQPRGGKEKAEEPGSIGRGYTYI
jgi:hypothetical protein